MDNRGVTPVVEKLLTIGIVVLFIGAVTAVLFGSAVPGYRDAVGTELGDRIVVSAAEQIESGLPPDASASSGRLTIDIPETIRGEPYTLRADRNALVLEHSDRDVGSRATLSLPGHVTAASGSIESRGSRTVRFVSTGNGLAIRLGDSA